MKKNRGTGLVPVKSTGTGPEPAQISPRTIQYIMYLNFKTKSGALIRSSPASKKPIRPAPIVVVLL